MTKWHDISGYDLTEFCCCTNNRHAGRFTLMNIEALLNQLEDKVENLRQALHTYHEDIDIEYCQNCKDVEVLNE